MTTAQPKKKLNGGEWALIIFGVLVLLSCLGLGARYKELGAKYTDELTSKELGELVALAAYLQDNC